MSQKHCSFCGKIAKPKTDAKGSKVILIGDANSPIICHHCVAKAQRLMTDPSYEGQKMISINAPLSPVVA